MSDIQFWIERAQSAEARLSTLESSMRPALDRVKEFKENFGVREKSSGELEIDFSKLAKNLGLHGALELRRVIDETYNVSGESGEKPRVKVAHG